MVFSSLLFVFLFLALNLVSQAALQGVRKKNIAMLVFSMVFFSWAGPRYVVLLLLDTALCWFFAVRIEREPKRKKLYLTLCVALVLLVLGIFKYTGFLLENLQSLFGVPELIPEIVLPIGISFYTFQLISYVVDVYRGEVQAQKKYWLLLLYASLFHQCIAGPIVRYRDVAHDIDTRRVLPEEVSRGVSRFTVGLAKKAVLANSVAVLADRSDGGTVAGRAVLYAADLSGLFRLFRYGDRHGADVRFSLQRKFQLSLYCLLRDRFLAAVAYLTFHLLPRLCVYSAGRQPVQQGAAAP